MEHTHQLVFQFAATTRDDFDRLYALSLLIEESIPEDAEMDGHDFGLGEFNIFVHTNDPQSLFDPICGVIEEHHPGIAFSAGFRNFDEDNYTVLWPPNSTGFEVL